MPARADFERYKQAIKEVFPDAADFSGQAYADRKYYFTWDPIHFLPSIAAKLVNEQLEKIVTPEQRLGGDGRVTDPNAKARGYCN